MHRILFAPAIKFLSHFAMQILITYSLYMYSIMNVIDFSYILSSFCCYKAIAK